jgi:hypothetical protein
LGPFELNDRKAQKLGSHSAFVARNHAGRVTIVAPGCGVQADSRRARPERTVAARSTLWIHIVEPDQKQERSIEQAEMACAFT